MGGEQAARRQGRRVGVQDDGGVMAQSEHQQAGARGEDTVEQRFGAGRRIGHVGHDGCRLRGQREIGGDIGKKSHAHRGALLG
jgi:hypothetical protein